MTATTIRASTRLVQAKLRPASEPAVFRFYPVTGQPEPIASGPDGALWFTVDHRIAGYVGRLSLGGEVQTFPTPFAEPRDIVAGYDGNLWVAYYGTNAISRRTPGGTSRNFTLPTPRVSPTVLAPSPDGYVWIIGTLYLATIDTNGQIVEHGRFPTGWGYVFDAVVGPDRSLWMTVSGNGVEDRVGRRLPDGSIAELILDVNRVPVGIAIAPDGSVVFAQFQVGRIGRLDPNWNLTEISLPEPWQPQGLTTTPDGTIWFAALGPSGQPAIGKLSPAMDVTFFPVPPGSYPKWPVIGADGNLWWADHRARGLFQLILSTTPVTLQRFTAE